MFMSEKLASNKQIQMVTSAHCAVHPGRGLEARPAICQCVSAHWMSQLSTNNGCTGGYTFTPAARSHPNVAKRRKNGDKCRCRFCNDVV